MLGRCKSTLFSGQANQCKSTQFCFRISIHRHKPEELQWVWKCSSMWTSRSILDLWFVVSFYFFFFQPDFPLLLKEPYWIVLHDRIVSVISSPSLTSETEWVGYPFRLFDFTACHQSYSEMSCSYTLALAHAVWHHSSIGQLSLIPK